MTNDSKETEGAEYNGIGLEDMGDGFECGVGQ